VNSGGKKREIEREGGKERENKRERERERERTAAPVIHPRRHHITTRRESEVAEQRVMVGEAMCSSRMESE